MSETSHLFSQIDPEAERKRALAKVYGLLLKLADEFKEDAEVFVPSTVGEKVTEPAFIQLELLKFNIPPQGL